MSEPDSETLGESAEQFEWWDGFGGNSSRSGLNSGGGTDTSGRATSALLLDGG